MLNRKTFFVSFFLRRDRVMKNGTAPIMARISVNGIAKEIYTQCRTAVDKWDPAKGRATGRDRLSYEVNAYIDDFRAKVIEIYRTLQAEGFEGNAIEIKERLKSPGKQVRMLLAELMLYCEKRQKEVGVRITQLTSNKYYRLCRYLHEYTRLEYKKEDIRLTEVTYGYLDGFNTFLQTAHRCHHNGAINILDCLRNFILYCLRNEWIEKNPFKNYKLKEVAPPPKEHLTKKEIEMLIAKPMPNLRLGNVRDIFVFCCFTGLSYSDMKKLTFDHIKTSFDGDSWIIAHRQKTGTPSHIEKQPRLSRAVGLRQHEPHTATYRTGLRVEKAYHDALLAPYVRNDQRAGARHPHRSGQSMQVSGRSSAVIRRSFGGSVRKVRREDHVRSSVSRMRLRALVICASTVLTEIRI